MAQRAGRDWALALLATLPLMVASAPAAADPGEWSLIGRFRQGDTPYRLYERVTARDSASATVLLKHEFDTPLDGYGSALLVLDLNCRDGGVRIQRSSYFAKAGLIDQMASEDRPSGWTKPGPESVLAQVATRACQSPVAAQVAAAVSAAVAGTAPGTAPAAPPSPAASETLRGPKVAAQRTAPAATPAVPSPAPSRGSEAPSAWTSAQARPGPAEASSPSQSQSQSPASVQSSSQPPPPAARDVGRAEIPANGAAGADTPVGPSVQLAAFADEGQARTALEPLRAALGERAQGRGFRVVRVRRPQGEVWRVLVDGFANAQTAVRWCGDLRRSGRDCIPRL